MSTRSNIVALFMGLLIIGTVANKQSTSAFGLCNICVSLLQYEGEALKELFQGGATGDSCAALCSKLPEAANETCNTICSFIGLQQFIGLITLTQFKPLKSCIAMHVCKFNAEAAANFTSFSVNPYSGDRGSKFSVQLTYVLQSEWPVGELKYQITDMQNNVIDGKNNLYSKAANRMADDQLDYLVGKKPGEYKKSFTFKPKNKAYQANSDYQIILDLCNTECGIDPIAEATILFHINNGKSFISDVQIN